MWIGVEVGCSAVLKVVVLSTETLVYRQVLQIRSSDLPDFLKRLDDVVLPLTDQFSPQAVGVAFAGTVSMQDGTLLHMTSFPFLENQPMQTLLEQRWSRPVLVGNDTMMAAFGEYCMHPEIHRIGARHLVYMSMDVTFGCGIVLNGHPYPGARNVAGLTGHLTVHLDGPAGECGIRGCVEQFLSPNGIVHQVHSVLWKYPESRLRAIRPQNLRVEDVFEAAHFQDPAAHEVIERSAQALGATLGTLINVLNPDAIVVGGSLIGSNEFFLRRAAQWARQYAHKTAYQQCLIVKSHLKTFAGAWGAALMALHHYPPASP